MATLLCTSRYRKAFGLPERLVTQVIPEGALGPWYANTLNVGSVRLLHYMSGPALLSVFIRLRDRTSAETRFATALRDLLTALAVKGDYIDRELQIITDLQYGRASDRSKLASLRDQANLASYVIADPEFPLAELNVRSAATPCGPMDYQRPEEVAPELLERTWRWSARR